MSRKYFGCAGHFICAHDCQFHIHTHVGGYCVSTVGEYMPPHVEREDEWEDIGYGRKYETMVFRLAGSTCGYGIGKHIDDHNELEVVGYNDHDAANEGHEAMCQKYEAR